MPLLLHFNYIRIQINVYKQNTGNIHYECLMPQGRTLRRQQSNSLYSKHLQGIIGLRGISLSDMNHLQSTRRQWYVMRDLKRPNSLHPAYLELAGKGFEVFTPLHWQLKEIRGRKVRRQVPFLPDLLFVRATRAELDPLVQSIPTLQYRYVRGGYRKSMIVADADMEHFMHAVASSPSPRYLTPAELTPAALGAQVTIVGGPLDGYKGRLLKMRGSRKRHLLVEIPHLLAAAVEVCPDFVRIEVSRTQPTHPGTDKP